jgi:hypothetical protein
MNKKPKDKTKKKKKKKEEEQDIIHLMYRTIMY